MVLFRSEYMKKYKFAVFVATTSLLIINSVSAIADHHEAKHPDRQGIHTANKAENGLCEKLVLGNDEHVSTSNIGHKMQANRQAYIEDYVFGETSSVTR